MIYVAFLPPRQVPLTVTKLSILVRNLINVPAVTTHALKLIILRPIPTPILGRNLTNVAAVTTHALQLVL